MPSPRVAEFLKGAWGALVGLEEAASALEGGEDGLRDALSGVGHRLAAVSRRTGFPRLAELGESLERFGKSFPPRGHPSFDDAAQLLGETLSVLPMVFDNVATEGREQIPQLDALRWRFDAAVPAAEALEVEGGLAAAPGEIDLALEDFRRRDPEALSYFGPEAEEHTRALRAGLARLRPGGALDADVLRDLFRHAHTVKGAAYTVGVEPIGRLTHRLEDLLTDLWRGRRAVGADDLAAARRAVLLVDRMLDRLGGEAGPPLQGDVEDGLAALEARLEAGGQAPDDVPGDAPDGTVDGPGEVASPDAPRAAPRGAGLPPELAQEVAQAAAGAAFRPSLRVELARVDQLLDEAGEVVVARRRLERSLGQLGAVREHLSALRRRLLDGLDELEDGAAVSQPAEIAADLGELGQDLETFHGRLRDQLGGLADRSRRLRADVGRLRRLRVGQLFERFEPLVEARAAELGKSVRLEQIGRRVELDSEVMERLVEPLTHLVQNALHHGLEGEAERLGAGKGRAGTLTLAARAAGRAVRLEVADDGRGLDLDGLRRKGVERGFVAPDADLDREQAIELLFLPGLSTEDAVSTGAGRGVGMDAVRQAIADLGGRMEVTTEAGGGSRFTLEVPATLMISEALTVRIGGRRFALPLPAVDRLLHVQETLVVEQEAARFLDDGGEKIELFSAAERLGLEPGPPPEVPGATAIAVRLAGAGRGAALEVEEVFGTYDVVVKPLGPFLAASSRFRGAFVDGDGEAVLVLDPRALVDAAAPVGARPAGRADGPQPTVLLADDSLSVRRTLARRLRRAGYRVLTARHGAEALELLLEHAVDALITDLDMPHLTGDVLIRRLRRRRRWRELPMVVVTGRAAHAERRGAIDPSPAEADLVLRKPVADGVLEDALGRLLGRVSGRPATAEVGA